jgi:hypothetical protein
MKIVHITGGHSKFPLSMGLKVPRELLTLDVSGCAGVGSSAGTDARYGKVEMDPLNRWLKEVIIDRIISDRNLKTAFYYFGPQDIPNWKFEDEPCIIRIPMGLALPPKRHLELLPIQKNYPEDIKKRIQKDKMFWWNEYSKNAMEDFGVDITIEILDA